MSNGIPSSWGVEQKFKNLIEYLTSPHLNSDSFVMRNRDVLFLVWNAVNCPELGEYAMDKIVGVDK